MMRASGGCALREPAVRLPRVSGGAASVKERYGAVQ